MTTGREGLYHTPYGTIEFTHTGRKLADILSGLLSIPGRPLRIATQEAALRDLRRVGRNIKMVNNYVNEPNQVTFFGCMKDTLTIVSDVTRPIDESWTFDEGNL